MIFENADTQTIARWLGFDLNLTIHAIAVESHLRERLKTLATLPSLRRLCVAIDQGRLGPSEADTNAIYEIAENILWNTRWAQTHGRSNVQEGMKAWAYVADVYMRHVIFRFQDLRDVLVTTYFFLRLAEAKKGFGRWKSTTAALDQLHGDLLAGSTSMDLLKARMENLEALGVFLDARLSRILELPMVEVSDAS